MNKIATMGMLVIMMQCLGMEQARTRSDLQKEQFEKKRADWEDQRALNCCAAIVYTPFCCIGLCMCYKCGKQYSDLKKNAAQLRAMSELKNVQIDDPRCCPCEWSCGCFQNMKKCLASLIKHEARVSPSDVECENDGK